MRWREQKRARKDAIRQYIAEYLATHPCVDCGETDIVVLDFDHLGDKVTDIGHMLARGVPLERVITEIAKCEVRCANDHRRITARRAGWWRMSVNNVASPPNTAVVFTTAQ